jgi:MoaA/NifB/PqqE/SkfB family radical SAM enzyme
MDFDLFTKIVDEAATIGAECLFLHGIGEPLLHPRFLSMLKYAKEHSNRFDMVGFCTNGTLLTEEVTDSIVELGVDRVLISLDGIGAVNERIRSGSVYNTIEKNINYLLLSRGKRLKPQVSLNVTISTQTDEELRDIYTVWHDHVDNVIFNPAVNDQFKILDLDRLKKWNPSFELGKFCIYPFRYMIILWNGEVQFCCHDFNGRGVVGNIANSNLLSVWNGEALRGVRHGIMSGKVRGTLLCNGCEKYSFHK